MEKETDKIGSNLDKEFVEKTEKAYQEITEVLRKYELILGWDEGEGILFEDYKLSKSIPLSLNFTNHDVWK